MENNEANRKSVGRFFKYLIGGFIISSIRVSLTGREPLQIVSDLFITFSYNLIVGIGTGLAAMFGVDLYAELKKNGINNHISIIKLCS